MPERPLTIATYAAGASLAAITLVYCFGPTFFLDDDAANRSKAGRKKGVVGLVNPANDCFINSVLQALAGLPDLRTFLIREVHRRRLDGPELYESVATTSEEEVGTKKGDPNTRRDPAWKTISLQQGLVTAGLKDVLDALNERPLHRKTISAQSFIRVVEQALRTRISRSQQDAQEFLQVVAERLADEHKAGQNVRRRVGDGMAPEARRGTASLAVVEGREGLDDSATSDAAPIDSGHAEQQPLQNDPTMIHIGQHPHDGALDNDGDFPMEGKLESQVECLHCHFKPKPSVSSFLTLTLNVPHNLSATTLSACFDGMFKIEQIDDFTCDRCRLEHALQLYTAKLARTSLAHHDRATLQASVDKLAAALRDDPEILPAGVALPDLASVPKRRIARHTRLTAFPPILAIHLGRSIWDPHAVTAKNMARVAFPETLPLGGLLTRRNYRLQGVVTHKGGHNSGHYESFRRQLLPPPPFSTPATLGTEGIYSLRNSPVPTPGPSTTSSPYLRSTTLGNDAPLVEEVTDGDLATSLPAPSGTSDASKQSLDARASTSGSTPSDPLPTPGLPPSAASDAKSSLDASGTDVAGSRRSLSVLRGKANKGGASNGGGDRWWRISDDKIKENKTADVLAMQREVYLLFYELVPEE